VAAASLVGGDGLNRPGQRRGAARLDLSSTATRGGFVLDDDAGRVVLDGDVGWVVLDGGEGIASISTSSAILSGNATSSFPYSPLRLGFLRMSWLWFSNIKTLLFSIACVVAAIIAYVVPMKPYFESHRHHLKPGQAFSIKYVYQISSFQSYSGHLEPLDGLDLAL
jgi:hypothetical protein